MIVVKKINGEEIIVNSDLIQMIEFSPHAVMSLTTGEKIIVDETRDEILRKVIAYKREIFKRSEVVSWI
jgi:flagellar protein FlbD